MPSYLPVPQNADVTRDTYDKTKSYDSLIWQKGKPVLDAELNEMQRMIRSRLQKFMDTYGGMFFNDALKITESGTSQTNNFLIKAGEGLVKGLEFYFGSDTEYTGQVGDETFIRQFYWDADVTVPALNTPSGSDRDDLVVAVLVMQEIDSTQDSNLQDPNLARETAIRWKVNVGVRV